MNVNDYIGSVSAIGQIFPSPDYYLCDGALINITDASALYSIVGTAFGGDGRVQFGLPDLRGRTAIGAGTGNKLTKRILGQNGGDATVLFAPETDHLPAHTHTASFQASALNSAVSTVQDDQSLVVEGALQGDSQAGGNSDPTGRFPGTPPTAAIVPYAPVANSLMHPDVITSARITNLPVSTTFSETAITVTLNSAGAKQEVQVPTSLPSQAVQFVINWDGLYPPRS